MGVQSRVNHMSQDTQAEATAVHALHTFPLLACLTTVSRELWETAVTKSALKCAHGSHVARP